ncbi:MAG: S1 RNA-binding domain-containing protein [Chloroflexi bacterium]|nr:S1 RNA-binding domain-containing protein [Chloroflexota bacterium]
MSVEERGKDEELTAESSSAELKPAKEAEPVEAVDEAASSESTDEEPETVEASAAVDGLSAVEEAADAAMESESSAEDESPIAGEPMQSTQAAIEDADAEDSAAGDGSVAPAAEASEAAAESTIEADEAAQESDAPQPAAESKKAERQPPAEEESRFRRGQICRGVISSTKPTAVQIDLGDGDQGIVPGRELELMTRKMLESLVVGAEVDVYVVNPRNHRGETILSINHALEELDWRNAEDYAKSKAVYEASIGGYNKGGLIVRFGRLRGFVPQSQLAEDRARSMSGETPEERYGPMVNQPIGVKVMEVERHRNRLILSERAALRDVRQARKEALIAELKVGDIRQGVVVSLENFGAFVDIGGGEGLVHLSELAWGHITHPRQAVKVGDEVEVEVISINPEAKRIGLSRRRILRDPWDEVATALRRGQLVRGRITKLTKFGAFARLTDYDAIEGLIHISELSGARVTHPREVVNRGDELVLRIVKIDIKDRRLGLSLKSVNSTEYLDLDWEMAIQESDRLRGESAPDDAPEASAEAESDG